MNRLQRIPLTLWAASLILWPMAVYVILQGCSLPLSGGNLIGTPDPDVWLRLTLVRDWLQGASWYDHNVLRTNAPLGGIASPWTRPVDMVIALFTQLQPASVDLDTRLIRAALLMPLLAMALLLFGMYRNVKLLVAAPSAPFMVTALIATCVPMWNYLSSGNADHHGLLAACFVWAMGGVLVERPSPRLIILSGLLFALQLWISPEAILLIAIVYGWYLFLYLRADVRASLWPVLATSIALFSTLALMAEHPRAEWFVPVYDSLSIVYVAMLWAAAIGIWGITLWTGKTLFSRLLFGAICFQPFLFVLKLYPLMRKGAMAEVDPYIISDFLPRITEAQPLFLAPPVYVLAMLAQPVMAVIALALLSKRKPILFNPVHLALLSYLLLTLGALYVSQQRFYYYFYPVVVLILAPLLASLFTPPNLKEWPARWISAFSPSGQTVRRLGLLAVIIGLPMALLSAAPNKATEDSRAIEHCHMAARRLLYSGELAKLGDGTPLTLFASTDLGGEVLFFTPHRIIASNYHREGAGIRYVWEADAITDPLKLRRYLAERNVDGLLLCPVVAAPEGSVLQRIRNGTLRLPWLNAVPYALPLPKGASPEESIHRPALFLVH